MWRYLQLEARAATRDARRHTHELYLNSEEPSRSTKKRGWGEFKREKSGVWGRSKAPVPKTRGPSAPFLPPSKRRKLWSSGPTHWGRHSKERTCAHDHMVACAVLLLAGLAQGATTLNVSLTSTCSVAHDVCACAELAPGCGWCSSTKTCGPADECTTTCRECPHTHKTCRKSCRRKCINTCVLAQSVCGCTELEGCGWCSHGSAASPFAPGAGHQTGTCQPYPECSTTCEECDPKCHTHKHCQASCYPRFRTRPVELDAKGVEKLGLFPIGQKDINCGIAVFAATVLASAAGIGGGAVLVPLFTMLGEFTEHEARRTRRPHAAPRPDPTPPSHAASPPRSHTPASHACSHAPLPSALRPTVRRRSPSRSRPSSGRRPTQPWATTSGRSTRWSSTATRSPTTLYSCCCPRRCSDRPRGSSSTRSAPAAEHAVCALHVRCMSACCMCAACVLHVYCMCAACALPDVPQLADHAAARAPMRLLGQAHAEQGLPAVGPGAPTPHPNPTPVLTPNPTSNPPNANPQPLTPNPKPNLEQVGQGEPRAELGRLCGCGAEGGRGDAGQCCGGRRWGRLRLGRGGPRGRAAGSLVSNSVSNSSGAKGL